MEANVIRGALELHQASVGFCAYDRYRKAIVEVERTSVENVLAGYGAIESMASIGAVKKRSPLGNLGRQLERSVRVASRKTWNQTQRWLGASQNIPDWKANDVFVVSGGTWDSLSENALNKIVLEDRLQLAVVLCDMIPVLFPHQFREASAIASFVQFAEFIAKHGSLTLSISESTKSDFDRFAQRLGIQPKK